MLFDKETKSSFSKKIENYVIKTGCQYMDSVLKYCEDNNIEPEVAAKYLTKPIKEKIMLEGQEINLVPRTTNKLF
tara:strand:- start:856 stop:1080 length:225 start_codon:yes stop_codon:yes gene_type:complete